MVVTGSMERIQYMTSDIACNTVNDNHNKLSVKYEDDDHHINSRQLDEDERSMGSAASSTEKVRSVNVVLVDLLCSLQHVYLLRGRTQPLLKVAACDEYE